LLGPYFLLAGILGAVMHRYAFCSTSN
jgi:hypothetical protein